MIMHHSLGDICVQREEELKNLDSTAHCSEQYQIKCIEMPEAAVEDFSTLIFLHIPCIQSTCMEEPTFHKTLTCLYKSKLYCGLHWCYHLLKSLFCAIVCYLYCALYYFNTSVKSLSKRN